MTFSKKYRRGYPVAILVGLEENKAVLWKVYSNVVKPETTVTLENTRKDSKAVYNFHESTVNAIRPAMKEGVKSIVTASPPRTDYASVFLNHVKQHHTWLTQGSNKATFAQITGSAATIHDVTVLTRTSDFRRIIGETTIEETENIIELLEKRLNAETQEPLVLYSIEEIENAILGAWIPGKPKPDYLLATDFHLSTARQKNRLNRLIQVASNRNVKTRTVNAKTGAGKRLTQLGGLVCILTPS